MKIVERLTALMQHLQLEAACFAKQIPGDIADLAAQFPERVTGLVLCVPTRLDTRPFAHVAPRLLIIAGEAGLSAETSRHVLAQLPGAQEHILPGDNAQGWSDVVRKHDREWRHQFIFVPLPLPPPRRGPSRSDVPAPPSPCR
jgi:hypothetical protein